jgi:hypothetical protein
MEHGFDESYSCECPRSIRVSSVAKNLCSRTRNRTLAVRKRRHFCATNASKFCTVRKFWRTTRSSIPSLRLRAFARDHTNPEGVLQQSPGSAAQPRHPGSGTTKPGIRTPTGFHKHEANQCATLLGLDVFGRPQPRLRSLRSRAWALLLNAYGVLRVGTEILRFILRLLRLLAAVSHWVAAPPREGFLYYLLTFDFLFCCRDLFCHG